MARVPRIIGQCDNPRAITLREWEKKFPWLKPSTKNPLKAVCHKCKVELTAEITPIKLHEKSAKHVQYCAAPSTSKTITELFASAKGQPSRSDAAKAAEIKLTAWMMEHNISFRASDHLCDVLKDSFPDSEITRNLKMKRTKCQSVCKNVLAKCYKEELAEKLRHNKFSILVDESTDVTTSQNVCIVARFAEEAAVVSKFWDLLPIFSSDNLEGASEGATSNRIFSSIMKSLSDFVVPVSNIIGFGSDGCRTMMGKNNSVSSKFKDLCPGIFIMKCICHSAHLCASEACKELPQEVEQLAQDVHNSLKHSSKRLAQFSEFQDFTGAVKYKILSPSRTRWLSLTAVVKRMLEQWGPLQLYFTDLNLQQCKTNTAVKNACENLHKVILLFPGFCVTQVHAAKPVSG
ncbi:Zinc finger protein 862 [Portunus trituberculatus]|uniref:Zinc finger protein 862 n=1 Tax=Portunus trituberculatus TaxID=210409 RepID=A0A5B7DYU2_PORTR|nr:Zinc finger protein 862 [Portunus trituberculatus]